MAARPPLPPFPAIFHRHKKKHGHKWFQIAWFGEKCNKNFFVAENGGSGGTAAFI